MCLLAVLFMLSICALPLQRFVLIEYGASFNSAYILILCFDVLAAVLLFRQLKRRPLSSFASNTIIFLFLFNLSCLITLLITGESIGEYTKSMAQFNTFVFPLLMLQYLNISLQSLNRVMFFLTLFILITVTYEIFCYIFNLTVPIVLGEHIIGMSLSKFSTSYRLCGTFYEPSILARICSILFAYYLYSERKTTTTYTLIFLLLLILLGTTSLSGLLCLLLAFLLWAYDKKLISFNSSFLIFFVALSVVFSYSYVPDYFLQYFKRIFKLVDIANDLISLNFAENYRQRSEHFRIFSNFLFLLMQPQDMVFGISFSGVDNFAINSLLGSNKVCSILSWIIISSGVVGLSVFLWFISRIYRSCKGLYRRILTIHLLMLMSSGSLLKPIFWIIIYYCLVASWAEDIQKDGTSRKLSCLRTYKNQGVRIKNAESNLV
ncbi:hypothetical protein [Desulfococcus multivorans]|uniref:Uncharacterized protein n=1 Tax=Desulfococcus multivorans DSM 2059 TaxID=1121405 RepID=S7U6T7_DESML|nr:hypothetical protein [Desulfococcus multivorans]AOY60129.1 uncharacterized protein Dmul_33590 [Desulfococcus multivorans]EPR44810.1 hypothetical protein dsmv_3783 [Desulfococcus multivorans DSM 2059]SKA28994.1 hypothetical protein SAMN02745446_03812 [Desulfococcus multivorans DSM 2059]